MPMIDERIMPPFCLCKLSSSSFAFPLFLFWIDDRMDQFFADLAIACEVPMCVIPLLSFPNLFTLPHTSSSKFLLASSARLPSK